MIEMCYWSTCKTSASETWKLCSMDCGAGGPAPTCASGLDISGAKLGAMWFTRVLQTKTHLSAAALNLSLSLSLSGLFRFSCRTRLCDRFC